MQMIFTRDRINNILWKIPRVLCLFIECIAWNTSDLPICISFNSYVAVSTCCCCFSCCWYFGYFISVCVVCSVYCAYFFFPSFWLFRFNFAFAYCYCCFSTYDYFVFCMAFNELLWRLFAMNPSNEFRKTTSWYGVAICCHFQNSKHIDIVGFTTDCLHIYLCFSFVFFFIVHFMEANLPKWVLYSCHFKFSGFFFLNL